MLNYLTCLAIWGRRKGGVPYLSYYEVKKALKRSIHAEWIQKLITSTTYLPLLILKALKIILLQER